MAELEQVLHSRVRTGQILEKNRIEAVSIYPADDGHAGNILIKEYVDGLLVPYGRDPQQTVHIMADHLAQGGLLEHWVVAG